MASTRASSARNDFTYYAASTSSFTFLVVVS